MYYLDIVDQFKTIDKVMCGRNYSQKHYYVRVIGTTEKGYHDCYASYKYLEVAKEVATRVSYFIGV